VEIVHVVERVAAVVDIDVMWKPSARCAVYTSAEMPLFYRTRHRR